MIDMVSVIVWWDHLLPSTSNDFGNYIDLKKQIMFASQTSFHQQPLPKNGRSPGWWFGTWLLFFHLWNNHPNWRTPSFFRGVGLNHQPVTFWCLRCPFLHAFPQELALLLNLQLGANMETGKKSSAHRASGRWQKREVFLSHGATPSYPSH